MSQAIQRQIPNAITVLRIAAIVPLVILMLREQYGAGLIVAFVAGASDALDGYLAKRYEWTTQLGGILDPLADKLLQFACYGVLSFQGVLPLWLFWLVLGRDVVIVTGGVVYDKLIAPVHGEPTRLSKANTFLQILLILWVLVSLGIRPLPAQVEDALVVLVAVSTAVSGIHYVYIWGTKAWQNRNR